MTQANLVKTLRQFADTLEGASTVTVHTAVASISAVEVEERNPRIFPGRSLSLELEVTYYP